MFCGHLRKRFATTLWKWPPEMTPKVTTNLWKCAPGLHASSRYFAASSAIEIFLHWCARACFSFWIVPLEVGVPLWSVVGIVCGFGGSVWLNSLSKDCCVRLAITTNQKCNLFLRPVVYLKRSNNWWFARPARTKLTWHSLTAQNLFSKRTGTEMEPLLPPCVLDLLLVRFPFEPLPKLVAADFHQDLLRSRFAVFYPQSWNRVDQLRKKQILGAQWCDHFQLSVGG